MQLTKRRARIVPFHEWPGEILEHWKAGRSPRSILDPDRLPLRWGPIMTRNVMAAYGAWLGWLELNGRGIPPAADFAIPDRKNSAAYATYLQANFADATVEHRISHLERAIALIVPHADRRHFKTVLANLKANGVRRDKRLRTQESASLVSFGIELMDRASAGASAPAWTAATLFRTGLQISLLAMRPLRPKNFQSLQLGLHLIKRGDVWWMSIDKSEIKNRQSVDVPFPTDLVEYLELYLAKFRPVLAGEDLRGGHLWISLRRRPQSAKSIAHNIGRHTRERYGRALNPHLFRDCAATSVAIHDSRNVGIIAPLLGHVGDKTARRHYNQARCLDASRRQAAAVLTLRSQLIRRPRSYRKRGNLK
jgi:integrase